MRVLLLSDVRLVGRKNEIKEVSDGYARNFLIARGLAVAADKAAEARQKNARESEIHERDAVKTMAERLADDLLHCTVVVGKDGSVFGAVGKAEIKKALEERGYEGAEPELPHSLKNLGEHRIPVRFRFGFSAEARVIIEARPERT